jgi:hypothetical protein
MAGRAARRSFDVVRRRGCCLATSRSIFEFPRQDRVLRAERGNKENAADVKANRALMLA